MRSAFPIIQHKLLIIKLTSHKFYAFLLIYCDLSIYGPTIVDVVVSTFLGGEPEFGNTSQWWWFIAYPCVPKRHSMYDGLGDLVVEINSDKVT